MAITTLSGYLNAGKQKIKYTKPTTATTVANQWHTLGNLMIDPSPWAFAYLHNATNASTTGRVPCGYSVALNTYNGFPTIRFADSSYDGTKTYLTGFDFSNTVAGRYMIYDRIWEAGPFCVSSSRGAPSGGGSATLTYTLSPDPCTYQYRVPGKADGTPGWESLELWIDISTAFVSTGAVTLSIGYINESSVAGRYTPTTGTLASYVTGRTFQLPLQAGDKGIIKVTDVSITNANYGYFNIYLARPLYSGPRIGLANDQFIHGFEKTGMPIISASAALAVNYAADSTSSGAVDCIIEIANG
jgi:hypothetical protein